jgi:hypothetical protein
MAKPHPGGYFFLTRDPPELRPAELRPPDLRPALAARGADRGADLPREAVDRGALVLPVEVVLTVRPELDLTRPDEAVLREGEVARMLRDVVPARVEPVRTRPAEVSEAEVSPRMLRVPPVLPAREFFETE